MEERLFLVIRTKSTGLQAAGIDPEKQREVVGIDRLLEIIHEHRYNDKPITVRNIGPEVFSWE